MFNIGLGEMIVVGLIALLVFGPERLPELAREAARLFNQVRGAADEMQRAILTETQPLTKPFEDIRDEIKGTARPIQDLQQELRAAPNTLDYKPVSRSEGENDHMPDSDVYEGEALPLVEHLREFRTRFIIALLAVLVTTLLVTPFTDTALQILISPLQHKPQALNPTDALVQWFRVAMVGGITLAIPIILYQLIAFLLPALTRREKRYIFFFLPAATLFFLGGILFGALVALPVSLNFLQNFGTNFAEIQWTLEAYVSFVTTLLLALGIGFQTPLVIFFLAKLGIVNYAMLIKNTRWAFLASSILAAVLTPTPDPWTMIVVMIPLFLLYLLGVLFARFA